MATKEVKGGRGCGLSPIKELPNEGLLGKPGGLDLCLAISACERWSGLQGAFPSFEKRRKRFLKSGGNSITLKTPYPALCRGVDPMEPDDITWEDETWARRKAEGRGTGQKVIKGE